MARTPQNRPADRAGTSHSAAVSRELEIGAGKTLGRFKRGTVQIDTWTRPDGVRLLTTVQLPAQIQTALMALRMAKRTDGAVYHFASVEAAQAFAAKYPAAAATWLSDLEKQLQFDGSTHKCGVSMDIWDQRDAVLAILRRSHPHLVKQAEREVQALASTWHQVNREHAPAAASRVPRRTGPRSRQRRSHPRRSGGSRVGSAASSGDDGPSSEPPRAALPLSVVGVPSADSDAAVARFLERFLTAEHPGMSWNAVRAESRRAA